RVAEAEPAEHFGGAMKLVHSTALCALIAAASMTWAMSLARAQGMWNGNTPVFQSDIERLERQLEAERAERRQQYNVVYPKFMDGGEKPDIKPVEPQIVYLEKNEPPGIIIVDTGGRKLYYTLPGKRAYAYPISVGRE